MGYVQQPKDARLIRADPIFATIADGCDQAIESYARRITTKLSEQGEDNSFFVCELSNVIERYDQWQRELPEIKPFYAVKCNNDKLHLAVLARLGCNFDCASQAEMSQVLALGVHPSRIIFAHPAKPRGHIQYAAANNVNLTTFDNESELLKMKELHAKSELLLRLNVCDESAEFKLGQKFGVEPETVAPELLRRAAELELKVVGICFHVGSGCHDPNTFDVAISHSRRLFDVGRQCGHNMKLLDIGGGYPGHKEFEDTTFQQIAAVVRRSLTTHFSSWANLRVIGEPGTFLAYSAYSLVANVIGKTTENAVQNSEKDGRSEPSTLKYCISDSVFGSFNWPIVSTTWKPHCRVIYSKTTNQSEALRPSALFGQTNSKYDCISKHCLLPELSVGDWLLFQNMGAYTSVLSTAYSGFEKPSIHYTLRRSDWMHGTSHEQLRSYIMEFLWRRNYAHHRPPVFQAIIECIRQQYPL